VVEEVFQFGHDRFMINLTPKLGPLSSMHTIPSLKTFSFFTSQKKMHIVLKTWHLPIQFCIFIFATIAGKVI
jgi:hypothetical protein